MKLSNLCILIGCIIFLLKCKTSNTLDYSEYGWKMEIQYGICDIDGTHFTMLGVEGKSNQRNELLEYIDTLNSRLLHKCKSLYIKIKEDI